MKSTQHNSCRAAVPNRWRKWPLLGGLLALALARAALGGDALYQNDAVVTYPGTEQWPPVIDATNFVNNNTFIINFTTFLTLTQPFYETSDTLNYTNYGLMMANTGFRFDTQSSSTGVRTMAGSFYNAGTISCGSTNDTTDPTGFSRFGESGLFGYAQCLVTASNIVNPGTVEAGVDGLIQFGGQNVDLTRGTLNIEGSGANIGGTGYYGLNTNYWDPSIFLGPNYAESAFFPIPPFYLYLPNSTSYFDIVSPAPSNNIISAVFIEDSSSSNVSYNVYFEPPTATFGDAIIEWTGSYLDPATGRSFSNYLYLVDDYIQGVSTNNGVLGGIPFNFTFVASPTKLIFQPPTPAGFYDVFNSGSISNRYAFANAQLISTTVSTNSIANQSITNMPGRIQISGTNKLDLSFAHITGPNYMSVQSTNQFDGSAGAHIASPYSDISVGRNDGRLTISNLMAPFVPNWTGTCQAWTTRWTNVVNGVSNDFRVLIVGSQLDPTTLAQVRDLMLHGTNSIVISDRMNVMRKFTADAQNLTLTTNEPGRGATSLDGELNLNSANIFWASALPNLLNLTNYGAIRMQNLAYFGGPSPANYNNFINHGLVSDQGSIIYADNFLSSGAITNGALGSFVLQSQTSTFTNGSLQANGDVSIGANTLLTSNLFLRAGRSLTLAVTNWINHRSTTNLNWTTNVNDWIVGANSVGSGFNLPFFPTNANRGDLLGTTVTSYAPVNRNVVNVWAATNHGASPLGYTNNVAVGRLILDARPNAANPAQDGLFTFKGVGTNNALYVDDLELADAAVDTDAGGNFRALNVNTNLVIYYAQAKMNGASVAEKMNGLNGNRLRWVPQYAGRFSSVQLVYPDGTTNIFNAALAGSTLVDSDGDGTPNATDPTPFFTPGQINVAVTTTNLPPLTAVIRWSSIPAATNFVYYSTNSAGPFNLLLTNFVSPAAVPPVGGWPIINTVYDPVNGTARYYQVSVHPNSMDFFGPGF